MYYAALEREREANDPHGEGESVYGGLIRRLMGKQKSNSAGPMAQLTRGDSSNNDSSNEGVERTNSDSEKDKEKMQNGRNTTIEVKSIVTDAEHLAAYRALRTASWQGACK